MKTFNQRLNGLDIIQESKSLSWKEFPAVFNMEEMDFNEFMSDMKVKKLPKTPMELFTKDTANFVKYLQLNSIKASGMSKSKIKAAL